MNLDKVRDLIRKSSKERRVDMAKQVKANKDTMMTKTMSLLNLQQQIHENFYMPDCRLTPIMYKDDDMPADTSGVVGLGGSVTPMADETCNEIQYLILSLNDKYHLIPSFKTKSINDNTFTILGRKFELFEND